MRRIFFLVTSLTSIISAAVASPLSDLTTANNRFAVSLYHELAGAGSGNLVFSPISLGTALSMAYAGARGVTASQMEDVLQIAPLKQNVHSAQREMSNSLQANCNSDTSALLTIANAAWSAGCAPKSQFVELVEAQYDAEARRLASSPSENARLINEWAAQHTANRIREVVTPEMLDTQLAMVITNAVYFLGRWEYPFKARHTQPGQFWLNRESRVDVLLMHQDVPSSSVRYLETDLFQAIELPYRESSAALTIFLPREKDGLRALASLVTEEWLQAQLNSMTLTDGKVDLSLPKVKTSGKSSMGKVLKAVGMPRAFEPYSADFSGICGSPGDVYIGDVMHATYLEIDERGTEAAAVTAIMMEVTSMPERPKYTFHCDHPFLFLIRDTSTNAILFMGQILDPRQ